MINACFPKENVSLFHPVASKRTVWSTSKSKKTLKCSTVVALQISLKCLICSLCYEWSFYETIANRLLLTMIGSPDNQDSERTRVHRSWTWTLRLCYFNTLLCGVDVGHADDAFVHLPRAFWTEWVTPWFFLTLKHSTNIHKTLNNKSETWSRPTKILLWRIQTLISWIK